MTQNSPSLQRSLKIIHYLGSVIICQTCKCGESGHPHSRNQASDGPVLSWGWGLRGHGEALTSLQYPYSHSSISRMPGHTATSQGKEWVSHVNAPPNIASLLFPPAEPELGSGVGPDGTGTPSLLRGKRGGHPTNYQIVTPRRRNERS